MSINAEEYRDAINAAAKMADEIIEATGRRVLPAMDVQLHPIEGVKRIDISFWNKRMTWRSDGGQCWACFLRSIAEEVGR